MYAAGTLTGLCFQVIQVVGKPYRLLYEKAGLHCLSDSIAPYIWYCESHTGFNIQSKHSKGCSNLQKKTSVLNVRSTLNHAEGVDTRSLYIPVADNNALPYLFLLLDCSHLLLLNYELYTDGAESVKLAKYAADNHAIPPEFTSFPESLRQCWESCVQDLQLHPFLTSVYKVCWSPASPLP